VAETAALVATLCEAGLDFIKDDEINADPVHAPLAQRIPAVMAAVRRHQDRTGKHVMVAFNITDETDAMRRHADLVAREGGTCVMASLNWCGFSAIETLRRSTDLALHGHRNGYGALSRHPARHLFQAYQTLWRLAGVDHMHVHGLQGNSRRRTRRSSPPRRIA
jgi:ribulose-bisphosphate carboxylase large chain